ncbi:MAG: TonB-dependent receptor plug domain-containing protein, partial [Acidobacteriota bacterium]|nr:TonB-dependent receptor plug domain-containing protein [Acidobacteriota bacterium]
MLDSLGARVPGAAVTLLNHGQRVADVVSDPTGAFAFQAVKEGRYQLSVRARGFASRTVDPFFIAAGARLVINVTLQAGLQEHVVVTAAADAVPSSQVGASVTVIDHDTLRTLATPDVLEALRLVPGLNVVQTGPRGGTTSVSVRGGESDFNKVLIDGVPANDIGGAFDFSDLTTTGVDRVEVLRDPNSVLYGSDALTGVISVATERGHTRIPELSAAIDGGTFGTLRQDLSLGGAVGRLDYFSAFSHLDTDNQVPNNAYHNNTFAGRYGWAVGSGTDLSVTVRHTGSRYGSPNAIDLYGIPDDSSQRADATYVGATLQSQLTPRWQTTLRFASMDEGYHSVNPSPTGQPFDPFGYGANYLGHVVTIEGANGYSVTGQAILDYGGTYPELYDAGTTRQSGYAQASGHLTHWLDLAVGTRIEHEAGSSAYQGVRSAADRTNAGAFAEVRTTRHRVFASAGLGYDHDAIFKSAVTPRVSVAVYLREPSSTAAFGATKLSFNAGTGIKAPSVAQELSSLDALVQGLPAGSRPVGAAELSPIGPERSRSFDVGLEQGFWGGRARVRISYFRNRFSDLIEYVSASVLPQLGIPAAVAAATGYGAYVNSSSYWAHGVELSGEVAVGPFVRIQGSYTHLRAVVTRSFASSALAPAYNPAFPDIPIGAYGPLVGAAPFRRPANTGSLLVMLTKDRLQLALAGDFVGKSDDST